MSYNALFYIKSLESRMKLKIKPTLGLSAFVAVMVMMSASYAGVSEMKNYTPGNIDVGTLTILMNGISSASYRPDTYEEFKKDPRMKGFDPKSMGLTYNPPHLSLTLRDADTRIRFRKLGIQKCRIGYWKDGFEPKNTKLIAQAASKRIPVMLHNVTANDKGECFFERFTVQATPLK